MTDFIAAIKGSYALLATPDAEVVKLAVVGWRLGGSTAWPVLAGLRYDPFTTLIAVPEPGGYVRVVGDGSYMPAADFQAYARGLAKK